MDVRDEVLDTLLSYRKSAIYGALVALGVLGAIHDGDGTTADVATRTGLSQDTVQRLLRVAETLDLASSSSGRTRLTERGTVLASDPQVSRDARFTAHLGLPAWAFLTSGVRTASVPVENALGADYWALMADNQTFQDAWAPNMDDVDWIHYTTLESAYPWHECQHIVDVGGFHGALLLELLAFNPRARGTVFDLPYAIDGAEKLLLRKRAIRRRLELVRGNFLTDALPADGDVYLLSRTLYNWDDEGATRLLRRIREAVGADGRLVVIEPLFDEPSAPRGLPMIDMTNFVFGGGTTRTRKAHAGLFNQTGFDLERVQDIGASLFVLVGRPK